jgi:threonine/homoserine/homoserine lactone efflux protein
VDCELRMTTRQLNVILLLIGLAGAIFLVYLGWWFAASVSATFWPT